jgi:hypothetical protein
MIASAGKSISESLDQEWENPANANLNPLAPVQTTDIPTVSLDHTLGKKATLPKRAACDSTWYEIDLADGSLTLYARSCTDSTVRNDTLRGKVMGDDTVIIAATGSLERNGDTNSYDYYSFTDLDGDSVLFNPNADGQQVYIVYCSPFTQRGRQTLTLGVDAGPSNDFENEDDNILLFASYLITVENDTMYVLTLEDGDGDGFVYDYGASEDSLLVDVSLFSVVANPLSVQENSTVTSRIVVFPEDSTKNYAIRYGVINQFKARMVEWTLRTTDGDSSFYPGDTIYVFSATRYFDEDSVTADTLRIEAILGSNPRDSLDDLISGIYLHRKMERGNERETVFSFTAETPLGNGEEPVDGTIYFRTTTSDNSWIEVKGVLDEELITADVELSDGRKYTVVWDREGDVVTVSQVE